MFWGFRTANFRIIVCTYVTNTENLSLQFGGFTALPTIHSGVHSRVRFWSPFLGPVLWMSQIYRLISLRVLRNPAATGRSVCTKHFAVSSVKSFRNVLWKKLILFVVTLTASVSLGLRRAWWLCSESLTPHCGFRTALIPTVRKSAMRKRAEDVQCTQRQPLE